jgi:hypothetical protein
MYKNKGTPKEIIWMKNQQQRSSLLSHHGILEYLGWDHRYKLLVVIDASLLPLRTLLFEYSGYNNDKSNRR